MKVIELMEQLDKLDPQLDIYLARDEEGNGFNLLGEVEKSNVIVDDYEIQVVSHPDAHGTYFDNRPDAKQEQQELFDSGTPAIVLWP